MCHTEEENVASAVIQCHRNKTECREMVVPHYCHVFYLTVLPTFMLLVGSDADDVFREDPLGKAMFWGFENTSR